MIDIIANGEWGRDDGIKCHQCGGKTYLVADDGNGLLSYNCENTDDCGGETNVQHEHEPDEPVDDDSPQVDSHDDFLEGQDV